MLSGRLQVFVTIFGCHSYQKQILFLLHAVARVGQLLFKDIKP